MPIYEFKVAVRGCHPAALALAVTKVAGSPTHSDLFYFMDCDLVHIIYHLLHGKAIT
jgi:hypothetical protein